MKKGIAFIGVILAAVIFAVSVSAGYFSDFTYKDVNGRKQYYSSSPVWKGYPDGQFHPEKVMTRAELICCLYRLNECFSESAYDLLPHKSPLTHYDGAFTDVSPGDWYYGAVVWAYEYGIVKGCGGGRFEPGSEINVFDYALIMFRYFEMRYDDEFWEFIGSDWMFSFVKNVFGYEQGRVNYVYYNYLDSSGSGSAVLAGLRDEFLKKSVLVDLPEWFSDEVSVEDLLKYDIWVGGGRDSVDMTRFSPKRGDIYVHFCCDYIDVNNGPS